MRTDINWKKNNPGLNDGAGNFEFDEEAFWKHFINVLNYEEVIDELRQLNNEVLCMYCDEYHEAYYLCEAYMLSDDW
jgi:hypothetical protein